MDRCSTWLEAEKMHRRALRHVYSMWRRPWKLARWITGGLEQWMGKWERRFNIERYGRDPWLVE
jgi:hypothetical protein